MPTTRIVIEFPKDATEPHLVLVTTERALAEAAVRDVPTTAKKRELHQLVTPYMVKYPVQVETPAAEPEPAVAGVVVLDADPEAVEAPAPLLIAEPEQAAEELPAKPKRAPSLAPKG